MIDADVPLRIPREDGSAPTQARAPRIQIRTACLPAITTVAAIPAAPATAAMATTTTPAAAPVPAAPPAIPSTPAPPTAAALCLGTCFVHHEVSPAEILTVQ